MKNESEKTISLKQARELKELDGITKRMLELLDEEASLSIGIAKSKHQLQIVRHEKKIYARKTAKF